jgi:hypothetical protein
LIHAAASSGRSVNLLQRDEVRDFAEHDLGLASEIDSAVEPFAVMDVEAQDADARWNVAPLLVGIARSEMDADRGGEYNERGDSEPQGHQDLDRKSDVGINGPAPTR